MQRLVRRFTISLGVMALFLLKTWSGLAQEESPKISIPHDKNGFHLLNPTPGNLLRELSTDRPDKTESPYTVDAGHFQVEMDLVSYSYDHYNSSRTDIRTESFAVGTANLKVGLCNNADFQLVVPTYNHSHVNDRTTGAISRNSGFGDLVARMKFNFWGNDGGSTAFAAMPFLKLPTNQDGLGNKAWEGGIILPLAVELPAGWSMGLMTEVDFNEDSTVSGYHPEFINSITFSHSIVGKLGGYAEFFSAVSTESGSEWVGSVDLGVVYGLTDNIQLDGGVNLGITRAADDFNPFVGITFRF